MPPAAGEIAADLDRLRRVDADDSSHARAGSMRAAYPTTPPTLHSIGEMHRPPRRVDADGTPRRGDRAAHAIHDHAAGVDAGQDAAALHSYIGESRPARRGNAGQDAAGGDRRRSGQAAPPRRGRPRPPYIAI